MLIDSGWDELIWKAGPAALKLPKTSVGQEIKNLSKNNVLICCFTWVSSIANSPKRGSVNSVTNFVPNSIIWSWWYSTLLSDIPKVGNLHVSSCFTWNIYIYTAYEQMPINAFLFAAQTLPCIPSTPVNLHTWYVPNMCEHCAKPATLSLQKLVG